MSETYVHVLPSQVLRLVIIRQQTAFDRFAEIRLIKKQAVVRKHNKPRPRVAHRGIARFLRIDPQLNQVVPWSLRTFPENFMQIGPAVFS